MDLVVDEEEGECEDSPEEVTIPWDVIPDSTSTVHVARMFPPSLLGAIEAIGVVVDIVVSEREESEASANLTNTKRWEEREERNSLPCGSWNWNNKFKRYKSKWSR